jgi:hypothetical protein
MDGMEWMEWNGLDGAEKVSFGGSYPETGARVVASLVVGVAGQVSYWLHDVVVSETLSISAIYHITFDSLHEDTSSK